MKVATLLFVVIFTLNFSSANAETKLELVQKYLGERFFKPAPKGEIFFVFKEGKVKRESTGQTYETLLFSNGFKNGPSAGLNSVLHRDKKGDHVIQPVTMIVKKIPKTYEEPSTTETRQKPSKRSKVSDTQKDSTITAGPIKLTPIEGMIPDSLAQDSIKTKVIVTFNFWSTEISAASQKTWETITYLFSKLFFLFIVVGFFLRFVAQSVSGDKPVKILALGLVSVNRFALKIFVWSSSGVLILSILVVGFFVLDTFLWICHLGLPSWLTVISLGLAAWLGGGLVNWAVPDLKDDTSDTLLLGNGHSHGQPITH